MLKKQEQMYALTPRHAVPRGGQRRGRGSNGNNGVMRLLEEGVVGSLREKHGDDMSRMAQGVVSAFDEMFSFSCPKFVTPSPPEAPGGAGGRRRQLQRGGAARSSRRSSPRWVRSRSSPRSVPT